MSAPPHTLAPTAWQEAAIVRIDRVTPHMRAFGFDAPRMAPHRAGQHVDVRLTAPDGYQAQRSYSISSAPGAGLQLLIDRIEDGEVSPFFHDVAAVGDTIELRGPLGGHFVWQPADGGPLLLVGGGSGLAPLVAMTRAWAAAPEVPVLMLASARTWSDVPWADELAALEARHAGRLRFVAAITRAQPGRAQDIGQRWDAARIGAELQRWGTLPRHAFVCGANPFVETVAQALLAAGVPAPAIRTERYGG